MMSAIHSVSNRPAVDVTQGVASNHPYGDALTKSQIKLLRRRTSGIVIFMAGPANVIMQLASYPVGRGVKESTVHSGSVYKHPFKRFRTTVGYLDIALWGDEKLRADYRHAVNGAHRQVHSTSASPVKYNAFNRNLQLWVASCIYYGFRDAIVRMSGPMTDSEEDDLLQACARFATTLQVPREMWHPNRRLFDEYWANGMRDMHFDDETRDYVLGVLNSDILPGPLSRLGGAPMRFFNIGFLPPELRDKLGLEWTARDEKIFATSLRSIGVLTSPLPFALRHVPLSWMSLNIKARRALGRPLV